MAALTRVSSVGRSGGGGGVDDEVPGGLVGIDGGEAGGADGGGELGVGDAAVAEVDAAEEDGESGGGHWGKVRGLGALGPESDPLVRSRSTEGAWQSGVGRTRAIPCPPKMTVNESSDLAGGGMAFFP
jgi:hypothetical protein